MTVELYKGQCVRMLTFSQVISTKLWKNDPVFRVALRTGYFGHAVSALLLVNPPLQTHLMDPSIGAAATAWPDPGRISIILLRSKADPAGPDKTQQCMIESCLKDYGDSFITKIYIAPLQGYYSMMFVTDNEDQNK